MFICLFVCLFVYLFIFLFIYLFIIIIQLFNLFIYFCSYSFISFTYYYYNFLKFYIYFDSWHIPYFPKDSNIYHSLNLSAMFVSIMNILLLNVWKKGSMHQPFFIDCRILRRIQIFHAWDFTSPIFCVCFCEFIFKQNILFKYIHMTINTRHNSIWIITTFVRVWSLLLFVITNVVFVSLHLYFFNLIHVKYIFALYILFQVSHA